MKIRAIHAEEILDSRGNPTVAATVGLDDQSVGWAAVPSGASTGKYEAVELRDGDQKRYGGLGVLTAAANVNQKIAPALIGLDVQDQRAVDETMIGLDGTANKASLGANAILAVSMAVARAAAASLKQPLYAYLSRFNPDFSGRYTMPFPQFNIMNGGKHADWATDIQEFMVIPVGATSVCQAVQMGAEIYQQLKQRLKSKGYSISVGDEGGFAPRVANNEEPFGLINEAVVAAGYQPGKDVQLGIDAAASEFFRDGQYQLKKDHRVVDSFGLVEFYQDLLKRYPIISLEDIFDQDDWTGFAETTNRTKGKIQVVGDDLYVTNIKRLQRGIAESTTNSILIKVNQIGTLTETIKAILLARQHHMTAVVSHRSGETEDSFIADLVVAMGTGQIKTGAPCRSERVAKYNRLMTIERELQTRALMPKFPFVLD
ncbi:phosphopyruvate hydratase [Patescibacteria group bacterium]|nr:phosphopyruvate hydratase [Patescibacteria group bacterium]MCL5091355.1 phosphopyruvate hydratase [Patescibacteria group bacterium]